MLSSESGQTLSSKVATTRNESSTKASRELEKGSESEKGSDFELFDQGKLRHR